MPFYENEEMLSPNYAGEADSLAATGQSDLFLCKK